jgi:hypothetical protein
MCESNIKRFLIITNGNFFTRLILEGVLNKWKDEIAGVIIVRGDYKGRSGVKAICDLKKL